MNLVYFYCDHCGCELENQFIPFSMTCANGDVCYCPICEEEVVVDSSEENQF
ncbi:MAG: hypothetical protein GY928_33540 [Colwellia sp.]|nr:hypothetical protein [Colwellia sp.]